MEQQLTNNNVNAGGSFIEEGLQQINVREVGLVDNTSRHRKHGITTKNGTAAAGERHRRWWQQGPKIRLGQFARAKHLPDGRIIDNDDVVSGIVLLRKGADSDSTLDGIHAKVKELNERHPAARREGGSVPGPQRSGALHHAHGAAQPDRGHHPGRRSFCSCFWATCAARSIVALTIPFSLLFAAICLDLRHIPANLLSLGALDFGMVVDGAVVMVENIVRHLGHPQEGDTRTPMEKIRTAAHEVQRPVFYSIGIIITAYLPIFTLQRGGRALVQADGLDRGVRAAGRADVFDAAGSGACRVCFSRKAPSEWHNPLMTLLTNRYRFAAGSGDSMALGNVGGRAMRRWAARFFWRRTRIGSEFLPHLDEGAIWVRGTLAPSTGQTEGIAIANRARVLLCRFRRSRRCTSQVGRPDDGTDTTGFFNTEYFVDLKPKEEWRPVFHQNKEELIAAMNRELEKIPGVIWNFSQPISDNMEEAVSGVKGELAIKVYGDDLQDARRQRRPDRRRDARRSRASRIWDCFASSASPI